MKTRTHEADGVFSIAQYSDCEKNRYDLRRTWDDSLEICQFIGLNPSTATELQNDPTVRRCQNYAIAWGYGGFIMSNIFAYRATDPRDMKACPEPSDAENDQAIRKGHADSSLTVACWGVHGAWLDRGREVLELLDHDVCCLGLTKEGFPKHPLYLRKDLQPVCIKKQLKLST